MSSQLAVCHNHHHQPAFEAHLEPVQQLAPYLSGLNVSEALDGFTQLADRILTGQASGQEAARLDIDLMMDSFDAQSPGGLSCASSQWLSSSSSSSSSSTSSVGFSSGANSPAPSDISSPSPSSCSSSSASSSKGRKTNPTKSNRRTPSDSRRRNNATAAERYRQKVKGRKCGLTDQLDEQLQRNERLRRQVEAKLALYGEFVALLASQTAADDAELAQLGAKSLAAVLAELGSLPDLLDGDQHRQLTDHLQHFQSVLRVSSTNTPASHPQPHPQVALEGSAGLQVQVVDVEQPQMLEYDFYADNFSFVACQ